jgi:UDP-N-acetylmuramate dehydrogenase
MSNLAERLAMLPDVQVERDVPLSGYTRFGLGGPADVLADAATESAFVAAYREASGNGSRFEVIGGGSNLVVSDDGYRGLILRYTGSTIRSEAGRVVAQAGADLQSVVDFTVEHGLAGIHTMTGIPGWTGGAVYGNAGAYGRSIHESVTRVRFFDGAGVREFSNAECGFRYRHSRFKERKDWIVLSAEFELQPSDASELRGLADEIRGIRDAKYPPTMKCAGSIFKNLIRAELPESVQTQVAPACVREGKVPSAWFLEQVGAKGMENGGIRVADYHANLIYNTGNGTARQVREIADELKARVRARFKFDIEEEVQYVGF